MERSPNTNELKFFANYIIGGRPHITSMNLQRIDNDVLRDYHLFATVVMSFLSSYTLVTHNCNHCNMNLFS
jgi:hypothetical protein